LLRIESDRVRVALARDARRRQRPACALSWTPATGTRPASNVAVIAASALWIRAPVVDSEGPRRALRRKLGAVSSVANTSWFFSEKYAAGGGASAPDSWRRASA